MKAKIFILIAGCMIMGMHSFGQVRFEPSDPFNNYSVGVGVGYSTIYGDLKKSGHAPVILANISRHIGSMITIGLEVQKGEITSNTPANDYTTGLTETNQFTAVNLNGRLNLSKVIKNPQDIFTKLISNCYVGTGVGLIDNDLTNITDKFKPTDTKTLSLDIKKSSMPAVLPFNFGFNIYLKKALGFTGAQLNVNYHIAYSFNDYVDGYSFLTTTTKNQYNDVYSILSVGLSFYLGHLSEY